MENKNNTIENKMQWFINMYNNGTLPYYVYATNHNFGAVCMPTGTGKSGVIIADIIKRIDSNKSNRKLVFNISCPILKLTQQIMSDLFNVLTVIYADKLDKFHLFINSSDSGNNYSFNEGNVSVSSFKQFMKRFVNDNSSEIAIVASCHKSLDQFTKEISKSKNVKACKQCDIYTYIDESHLISLKNNIDDENGVTQVNLNVLCNHSNVFAFSATPTESITKCINIRETRNNKYLHLVSPIEAINAGTILAPYIHYIKVDSEAEGISKDMCIQIMEHAKKQNRDITQKILVTLKSTDELEALQKELRDAGQVVFSTCARNGFDIEYTDDNGDVTVSDNDETIIEFMNAVSKCEQDCFVLHIRQLIQGIDITSLTGCIIWTNSNGDVKTYRHIIQTIGRTLRVLPEDREKDIENRIKKFGAVYFITPSDNSSIQKNLQQFTLRYYGINNVLFEEATTTRINSNCEKIIWGTFDLTSDNNWDREEVQDLYINLKNAVDNLVMRIKVEEAIGFKVHINEYINNLANSYMNRFMNDMTTIEFLTDNSDLITKISNILKENGINC